MTTPTTTLEINFNNYFGTEENAFGTINNGISIYNQRYSLNKALKTSLTLDQIKPILEKVIKGTLVPIYPTTSNPFDKFAYEASSTNSSTYLLQKNQIMIFECKRTVNGQIYYSYYCYFKDNGSNNDADGNVWLIFITLANVQTESVQESIPYPVIFDLQDNLEPTFTYKTVTTGETSTNTIASCSTGNFDIKTVGTVFNYDNIKLKNTSFNLSYDEKKEVLATIIPMGGFKAQN